MNFKTKFPPPVARGRCAARSPFASCPKTACPGPAPFRHVDRPAAKGDRGRRIENGSSLHSQSAGARSRLRDAAASLGRSGRARSNQPDAPAGIGAAAGQRAQEGGRP